VSFAMAWVRLNGRMKMSEREMDKILDDVFRKVFGELW
jgi:hypothetical protein